MLKFIKDNKEILAIVFLLALFFIVIANLTTCNNPLKGLEKGGEKLIDSLNKVNVELTEEAKLLSDSIVVLHNAAIHQNNIDTIYINHIKYLKTKTNEDLSKIDTNTPDSNIALYGNLSEEYISTGFNK